MDNFHVLYLAVAVAGVTALVVALPLLFRREKSVAETQSSVENTISRLFGGWKALANNRRVLTVSFVQACLYYAYGAVEFYLAGYLPEVVQLDKFLTGIILTSIIGVAIFARPYMGRVSDRIGRRIPIIVGCVLSGLPLLAIPFVADFWVLLLLVLVYGFGFATVTASTSALISELVPKELVGASMGFLDTVMDVGQTLGPIVSGLILATSFAYVGVFCSLAFVLLLAGLVFVLSNVGRKPVSPGNYGLGHGGKF
jgi:MFS family permease